MVPPFKALAKGETKPDEALRLLEDTLAALTELYMEKSFSK